MSNNRKTNFANHVYVCSFTFEWNIWPLDVHLLSQSFVQLFHTLIFRALSASLINHNQSLQKHLCLSGGSWIITMIMIVMIILMMIMVKMIILMIIIISIISDNQSLLNHLCLSGGSLISCGSDNALFCNIIEYHWDIRS